MNAKENGGPAFPAQWMNPTDVNKVAPNGDVIPPFGLAYLQGMTLRDYFAAKAMPVMLDQHRSCDDIEIAKLAYDMADSMLRQRVDPDCPSPYRLMHALGKIANGANGKSGNDTQLADIAKRVLNMEVDE